METRAFYYLLPMTRHVYPSGGCSGPMALDVDCGCTRSHDPVARYPDVVGSRPAPITLAPNIVSSRRDRFRLHPRRRRGPGNDDFPGRTSRTGGDGLASHFG